MQISTWSTLQFLFKRNNTFWTILKLLFDYHCQNFHFCRQREAPFYNPQTTLSQTVSTLLLLQVNGTSERNVIPATKRRDNSQLSELDKLDGPQPNEVRSTRYYPSRVIFEKKSSPLILSLAFYSLLGSGCDPNRSNSHNLVPRVFVSH